MGNFLDRHPALDLLAFAAVLLAWFLLVQWALSRMSGWRALALKFPAQQPQDETRWRNEELILRGHVQLNWVTVGASRAGLSLTMFPLLRIAFPRVRIPWNAIVVTAPDSDALGNFAALRVEGVPIRVRRSLLIALRHAAGTDWPEAARIPAVRD